jgi:hypothetical protein
MVPTHWIPLNWNFATQKISSPKVLSFKIYSPSGGKIYHIEIDEYRKNI